eukprot:1153861-Pelagomonas_calceolata.AAC.4
MCDVDDLKQINNPEVFLATHERHHSSIALGTSHTYVPQVLKVRLKPFKPLARHSPLPSELGNGNHFQAFVRQRTMRIFNLQGLTKPFRMDMNGCMR